MSEQEARTVLVVEDEDDVAEILSYSLRREGFRVLTASEAAAGLAVVQSERPDVVLLDVMMPGITGWEMLERMQEDEEACRIPVIVVTVLEEPRFLEKAAKYDAAGYIQKPFRPEEVLRTVRSVLDREDR